MSSRRYTAAALALVLAGVVGLMTGRAQGQAPEVCWFRQLAPYGINAGVGTNRITPAAGGSVLVGGDAALACLKRTGELRWVFHFQRLLEAVADNETFIYPARQDGVNPMWVDPESELVFLGASSRVLYAIDIATGALRWSWSGARSVFESVIGADGRVHVETTDFKHWALDIATGRVLWNAEFRRVSNCQTGVFNGVLVRPNIDGLIFGLNATSGAYLWQGTQQLDVVQQLWEPDMPFRTFPEYPLGLAYVSDSSGDVVAIDLTTGKYVWRVAAAAGYNTKWNHRMNLELWGDLLIVHSQGFISFAPGGDKGIIMALNALTGERLWIRDDVYPSLCGMTVSQGLLVYSAFIQPYEGDKYGPGPVNNKIQLVALHEDGSEAWKIESNNKVCTGSLQELDGIVYYMYTNTTSAANVMEIMALPAAPRGGARACPAGVLSPDPEPVPPTPAKPMMTAPAASDGPYCWKQTMAFKPLASPATDNKYIYVQDNAGLIMAIDIRSGEAAWKATAGPGSVSMAYPTNILLAEGLLFLGTAASEVQVRNASTGHLLWRRQSGSRPNYPNLYPSFYGYPAYANGIMYIGTPDAYINAYNATTGEEVWSYYIGVYRPDTVQYSAEDNLVYAISHDADVGYSDQLTAWLLAFDATDGTVVWERKMDSFASESGFLNVVNGVMVFATNEGELRAYSAGRGGGDLLWTYSVGADKFRKQESALLVDGSRLGLNDTDVVFWGDADSSVRALRTSDLTVLWQISLRDIDVFPEVESLPPPVVWLQFTLSNGALYIPSDQGLFVVNVTNGAPLWTDLRGRINAMVLVVERPELGGAQVVYGRYLSNVDSNVPACRPNNPSGGISTLATDDSATTRFPVPSPAAVAPVPTAAPSPSPSPSQSPSPSPSTSPSPSALAPPSPKLSSAAKPSSGVGSFLPAASPAPIPTPAPTCPPCPARANCSSAPAPAPTTASMSLGLTVVSVKLLKADKSSQDRLQAAVSKLVDSKSVRVSMLSVEAVGGSSSGAAVVRLSLKASSSKALAAAVEGLQDAALDGELQAALGAKGVRGGALAAAKVRSVVVAVSP